MNTPQVKAITDRQEMEAYLKDKLGDFEDLDGFLSDKILNQEGWYYVSNSPCTCPRGGEQGHNLTCGYYFKGIVQ